MWILSRLLAFFTVAFAGFAAIAHAADAALVTEVTGAVVDRAAKPVRALDVMKPGERLKLPAGAKASVFVSSEALLYALEGPMEVSFGAQGLAAVKGTLPAPTRLNEAYRKLKVDDPSLVQATLVMRGRAGIRAIAPEGVVLAEAARAFRWTRASRPLRLELATEQGQLVFAADVDGESFVLPDSVSLAPGAKYVWGLSEAEGAAPVDWTEFAIATKPPGMPPAGSPARAIHGAWLRAQGLPRAASRVADDP